MADETTAQDGPESKKKKGKLPLWIGAIVVVELAAAIAIVQVVAPGAEAGESTDWEKEAQLVTRVVPDVIVNLMDDGAKRILRVQLSFQVLAENPVQATAAIERPGLIEDKLIVLLSRKRLSEVQGRQAELKREIIDMLHEEVLTETWREENGQARVTELLMPTFVIQ
jgi:flagellar basal body-associated protein FliL